MLWWRETMTGGDMAFSSGGVTGWAICCADTKDMKMLKQKAPTAVTRTCMAWGTRAKLKSIHAGQKAMLVFVTCMILLFQKATDLLGESPASILRSTSDALLLRVPHTKACVIVLTMRSGSFPLPSPTEEAGTQVLRKWSHTVSPMALHRIPINDAESDLHASTRMAVPAFFCSSRPLTSCVTTSAPPKQRAAGVRLSIKGRRIPWSKRAIKVTGATVATRAYERIALAIRTTWLLTPTAAAR
mmetsp:Transcript_37045/g.86821  ORF Transcript_37045/g.86821 Transcript_37045/m.86821 type:complete len:243 (+) Transcript_37045:474-1202(+)